MQVSCHLESERINNYVENLSFLPENVSTESPMNAESVEGLGFSINGVNHLKMVKEQGADWKPFSPDNHPTLPCLSYSKIAACSMVLSLLLPLQYKH